MLTSVARSSPPELLHRTLIRGRTEDAAGEWTAKRERQYEHVKESLEEHGKPAKVAKGIAARTVNKERARKGESTQASRSSTQDISSRTRGGLRSLGGPGGRTRQQLSQEAKRGHIAGRSTMTKAQLESALDRR